MQTYLEKEQLSVLLEQARQTGEVRIRRDDGLTFVLAPEKPQSSPLDTPGLNLQLSAEEIIGFIRESRKPTD